MITKQKLESLKRKTIKDVDIKELKDISMIFIDKSNTIADRIRIFVEQVGNPYLFRVGETPIKVSFASNSPTLQHSLEVLLTKDI